MIKPQATPEDFENLDEVYCHDRYESRALSAIIADARAYAALAQQPAPEALREAVAETIYRQEALTGAPDWNEIADHWKEGERQLADVVIAAHIAPLLAERNAALATIQQANILFSNLTPGGSDFQDWKRCVDYALETRRRDHELLIKTKKEANAALAEAARLREALATIAAHNGGRWLVDANGLQTRPQPSPQEIARAALKGE